jgi:hypothetical protein
MVSDGATTADGFRSGLLAIILFGSIGVLLELLLIGHTEDWWQILPLGLLAGVILVAAAAWFTSSRRVLTALRLVMWTCVLSGLTGQWLHYSGNVEFEREMYPNLAGMELFQESMSGATPVLAPGTMTVIGLLGLVFAWRHPSSKPRAGS